MIPTRPSAWILNLDAEYELEALDAHTSSARTMARIPALLDALAPLLGPDGIVLGETDRVTGSYAGRAWCPTPSARLRLERAGAVPVDSPEIAVLRRVNHRRFSAELGQSLPGARYVYAMGDLASTIAGPTPSGHWLLKRPFGFAGRGRRRVAAGALEPAAESWVLAALRSGEGLQVEPWVERRGDFALHGYLAADGTLTLGEPTSQECDASGSWRATTMAVGMSPDEITSLRSSAIAAGEALARAGYFGPFGVDAFRWKHGDTVLFNARSEINARYSMGWATGMAMRRVDLD
jgi:hypothetical protein